MGGRQAACARRGRVVARAVIGALPAFTAFAAFAAFAAASPAASAASRHATFYVGFSKQNITPAQLPFDYLGGEGYQRVGTTVVSPLYVRTIAIAAADRHGPRIGAPVVIS